MKISVTEECITCGLREDCTACPVALAIARVILPGATVSVFLDTIEFHRVEYPSVELPTPPEVHSFVATFDAGEPVVPFDFEIDIPKEFLP